MLAAHDQDGVAPGGIDVRFDEPFTWPLARQLLEAETELLYDELELLADGRLMHCVLVWPDGELWIRVSDVRLESAPAGLSARR